MKRIWLLIAGVCALGGAVFTSGCGPGLVAAGGGSVGAIFGIQSGSKDKKSGGGSPAPTTNVIPAVVVTSVSRELSPVAISYTIIDANNDACSVEVQYALGGTFQPCFQGTGGDATSGLSSSASGDAHVFSWDFAADLGPGVSQGLNIRIRANDGITAGSWATLTGVNVGNEAPEITNIQAFGLDVVLFTFDLTDANSDLGTLEVSYSTDQGQNFFAIDTDPMSAGYELLGNPPTNLLTSSSGSPGQFIWNAGVSLNDFLGDVLIQVRAKDQPAGYTEVTLGSPIVAGPFSIDTSVNGPPTLQLQSAFDGLTFTGKVPVDILLQDDESDAAAVIVQYNLDDGTGFHPATLVAQFAQGTAGPFPTSTSPTAYTIVWDCLADIGQISTYVNSYSNVLLVLVPVDGTAGIAEVTDAFTIIGNEAPSVTDVQVLQDSGNVPVVIRVQDDQSDPVSVAIQYSTDGTNYTALSAGDFVFGSPTSLVSSPTGADNVLVWNTSATFPGVNEASVTLRVTPTDHPPSGPTSAAADLTGTDFTSGVFPIINNPNGAAPISIDIFTTNAGGTPNAFDDVTVAPSGVRYFDRTVNPSTATVTNTYWKILETGADYGTLVMPVGTPITTFSQGSVTVAASVSDGSTFLIDDGLHGPQTFEFDDNSVLVTTGNVPVNIAGLTTQDQFAQALTDAINGNANVRIVATYATSGVIQLKHEIACNLGDAASFASGGNAADMAFTGGAGVVGSQMNGGAGLQQVEYQAPATTPAGSSFVTLVCVIDDVNFFTTVFKTYRLWWGDAPTAVSVAPATASKVINGTQQFTATVTPASAPQVVAWEVVGGSGTISNTGLYTAPSSVPTTNPVTIKAHSVSLNPSVMPGTASITIQPEPTSVTVTPPANNPPNWVAPDLALGASITFTASVLPAAAPSGVQWRIVWNSQDWGSGNTTVGTINTGGTYTAPQTLPSPDTVRIDAVSTSKPSIFGSFFVHLVAPAPTSFSVSPPAAVVFAGGAGQQFTTPAASFTPTNANQSVTWEISPVVGTISGTGFYSPPTTSAVQQNITVTARSAVNTTVTASAVVTLNPPAVVPPTGVAVSPPEGITLSSVQTSQPIQFTAVVAPAQASQTVTWSMVAGSSGSINMNTGLYTPSPTTTDQFVTIRATASASPNPFQDVDIYISGDGHSWQEIGNLTMGRGDASGAWDPVNDRVWFVGGRSETAATLHDDTPLYLDITSTPSFGAYGNLAKLTAFPKLTNCIMCICDELNDRLVAVVGQGATDTAEIYELDLNSAGSGAADWTRINAGNQANAPKLGGTSRYHTWWDAGKEELYVLKDRTTVYRYGTNIDNWKSPVNTQSQSLAPVEVNLVAHSYDEANDVSYFVGAGNTTAGANNEVWSLQESDYKWRVLNSSGSSPTSGVQNGSSYYHNGKVWFFGGREANKSGYNNALYSISIGGTASWNKITAAEERPAPRGDAAWVLTDTGDVYLYGGELAGGGTFGDLWWFDESGQKFIPENAQNIRPQGRKGACGVWEFGEAIIYGGNCDYGPSNELWTFDFVSGSPVWERQSANGTLPPAMWGCAMVLDELHAVNVMFGGDKNPIGATGSSGLENSVWTFDTSSDTWTQLTPGGTPPSPRREAALCWDDDNNRIWMFGGSDSTGPLNDLWYLNVAGGLPGTWQQVSAGASSPPDRRSGATIGYDSRKGRVLVCGGDSQVSGPNRQLYAFTIATGSWAPLSVANTGQEEDINGSGAVFDDEFARIIHMPIARKKTQAIVLGTNGPIWQYMTPPPLNNNTTGALGLYDQSTGRYYALFGERTILSRPIGTNAFRTLLFK